MSRCQVMEKLVLEVIGKKLECHVKIIICSVIFGLNAKRKDCSNYLSSY